MMTFWVAPATMRRMVGMVLTRLMVRLVTISYGVAPNPTSSQAGRAMTASMVARAMMSSKAVRGETR